MRISEAIGLRWGSVDENKNTVKVENGHVRDFDENGKEFYYDDFNLKTEASTRIIPIQPNAQFVLNEMRRIHPSNTKRNNYVFITSTGTNPRRDNGNIHIYLFLQTKKTLDGTKPLKTYLF